MGCWFAKSVTIPSKNKNEELAKYSWDQKGKPNPKDFTIDKAKGCTTGRLPGTIKGQQFIIQNCEDANIYLFDHSNTVTVDDCVRCNLFVGPVKGSVFIRNCQDCKCIMACQQFRVRDSQKLDVLLSCTTQPIIESSTAIKFGCFCYNYPELEGQFRNAGLSEFNNNWCDVHDFTPVEGENNWGTLNGPETKFETHLPMPNSPEFADMKITTSTNDSFVPITAGTTKRTSDESCLVVFFSDGQAHERAKSFIRASKLSSGGELVSTKQVMLEATNAKAVFNTDSYAQVIARGPVVGLEYNGKGCLQVCQTTAMNIARETGSTGLVYVSSNASTAAKQIDRFFNFANMQMS